MKAFLKRFLAVKPLPVLLAIVAVALVLPAVWTGWQMDDLIHRYMLLGYPDASGNRSSPLDLFYFLDGDSVHARVLLDAGVIPWWSLTSVRLSFWRPLSSLTHWLDYLLWPESSILMHLHSFLWFGALVYAAALLYRRILGGTWIAGLAALFFAVDDAHGLAAGWLANRNALLAGVFGLVALLAHDRWRRVGWRPGAVAGPLFLLLGLLSGESALAVCGYLLAYALFVETAGARARVLTMVPYAGIAGCWLIAYTLLGYGAQGSGFYVDPLAEPVRFLSSSAWKAPLLLVDQWALPPSSFIIFVPEQVILGLLGWAVACLALIAVLVLPLVRRDRTAGFWATGMLLSIPLVCSTKPHSRLLLFAGIGGFGLLAQWIGGVWEESAWLQTARWWRAVARAMVVAFFVVHIPLAVIQLPLNATSAAFGQRYIQDPAEKVEAGPEFAAQDLIILNHPIVFYGIYFRGARLLAGQPAPHRMRVLAPGRTPVHVFRTDEYSLTVRPEGGYLGGPFDDVFRGPGDPLRLGEQVHLAGLDVRITRMTEAGRPAEATFRWEVPLDDPSLRWVQWEAGRYAEFSPPAVGDSCTVPGSPLLN